MDEIRGDIQIILTDKQLEFERAIHRHENTLFGGAKGGGKSHGLREIMLLRRFEIPDSYGVIFRKTYPELFANHISPLLKKFPILQKYYNSQNKELRIPNGSILAFRHCQYERDLSLHQGQEYHDLAIEEVGEWPENWFWTLKGSNRSSIPGIKPRCLLTGNPGGIGHKWLKRLFVDRQYRHGIEDDRDFAFIPAKVKDNPALMVNDPNYINRLRANKSEHLVKAYVDGSWDIMAGQFFDMVSRETHVIKAFQIPDHWEIMGAFDTGYTHPAAFVFLASDTDGNVYVCREYAKARRRTDEIVEDLRDFDETKRIKVVPAGRDCWTKHSGDPSVEEKFAEAFNNDIILHPANIERIPGAQHMRDYLALRDSGEVDEKGKPIMKPKLFFFDTCPLTFNAVVRMTHDPDKPEDVLKVDAEEGDPDTGDDLYDALRYGLMDRPRLAAEPVKKVRDRYARDRESSDVSWTTV